MLRRLLKINTIMLFFSLSTLYWSEAAIAAGIKYKVAILPVEINANQKLDYLSSGVREMLASRLAAGNEVAVLERSVVDQAISSGRRSGPSMTLAEIIELGKALDANQIVSGSILSLGGGMSLDFRVYSVTANEATFESFFATVPSEAEIIAAIDRLAVQIAEKKFGLALSAGPALTVPVADPTMTASTPSQTAHPDKAYSIAARPEIPGTPQPAALPAFIVPFTKSQNLDYELQAMDVGDIDADGQDEVVVALKTAIIIYKRQENTLKELTKLPLNSRYRVHGVFIADLNADNRREIYISAADHLRPNSLAVEWLDGKLQVIFKDAPYYLKPINIPGTGMILAGQRGGFKAAIEPGIYRVQQEGGKLLEEERIKSIPSELNLFNFAFADLDGDSRSEIVAIDSFDSLRVFDPDGKPLWTGGEYFGGVTRYIGGGSDYEVTSGADGQPEMIYIPSRLIVADLNNDGRADVVIKKDLGDSSRLLKSSRKFPNGAIDALSWNGIALTSIWSSGKIDGYIADYQVRPAVSGNADPQKRGVLHLGLVISERGLFSSATSTVLFYPVPFSDK